MDSTCKITVSDFQIDISVRISDINYGGHLGHAELIKITHQARLKFFSKFGLSENNIEGAGVIVKHLSVEYKAEAFFDEMLTIHIRIAEITKTYCIFSYEIFKNNTIRAASVLETILFMNYKSRRIVRVPQAIHNLKKGWQLE